MAASCGQALKSRRMAASYGHWTGCKEADYGGGTEGWRRGESSRLEGGKGYEEEERSVEEV